MYDCLIHNIVKEGCIADDCRKTILVPVYKGKDDPLVCGSYRAIQLLEQPMKVLESVRKEDQMSVDNMQFHYATSTRETPSKEEEAVLCFCGFRRHLIESQERW